MTPNKHEQALSNTWNAGRPPLSSAPLSVAHVNTGVLLHPPRPPGFEWPEACREWGGALQGTPATDYCREPQALAPSSSPPPRLVIWHHHMLLHTRHLKTRRKSDHSLFRLARLFLAFQEKKKRKKLLLGPARTWQYFIGTAHISYIHSKLCGIRRPCWSRSQGGAQKGAPKEENI